MPCPPTPNHYPNLPVYQRFTQWLVDRFNDAECQWRLKHDPIAAAVRRHAKKTRHAMRESP